MTTYKATMALRIARTHLTQSIISYFVDEIQQLWIGDDGSEQWKPLPIVEMRDSSSFCATCTTESAASPRDEQ